MTREDNITLQADSAGGTWLAPDADTSTVTLRIEGNDGSSAEVGHGSRAVSLVIDGTYERTAALVFTPDGARRLAALLTEQAEAAER